MAVYLTKGCIFILAMDNLWFGFLHNSPFNKSIIYELRCVGLLKSACLIFSYNFLVLVSSNGTYPHTIAYNTIPLAHISVLTP